MKVPRSFLSAFTDYLNRMCEMGKLSEGDFTASALAVFSSLFGYAFLNASFGKKLTEVEKDDYIKSSVQLFLKGFEV